MKKQIIAIVIAAVLALAAVIALVTYARNADDRALEGTETVEVLQATEDIAAGTPVGDLEGRVRAVTVPKSVRIPEAVDSLDEIDSGQVTTVGLIAGDQLSTGKFDEPSSASGSTELPEGLQELTIPIDGARLAGGVVDAGDRVGVFTSYSSGQVTSNPINQLLVLKVNRGVAGSDSATGALVTVAVNTLQAQQIVHAQEFGTIWMSLQNPDTVSDSPGTIDQANVAP